MPIHETMPMHALDILAIVGSHILTIVGVGIALAALILRADSRSQDKFDKAMERSDSSLARSDERFDAAMAEIASDRRAHQASMDEFRRQMQRLAERQSRVEGRRDPDPNPESVAAQ